MGKKPRSQSPAASGVLSADIIPINTGSGRRRADRSPAAPARLSEHQMESRRPTWANFEMENAFWDRLQQICELENISFEEIVQRARTRHSNLFIGMAVRLEVIDYFREEG